MSTNPAGGYEVTVLEHQLRRQLNFTIVVALLAIAALLWTLAQSRASSRHEQRMSHISAVIDSLDQVATLQRLQISPLEQRVETIGSMRGQLEARLRAKAEASDVRALGTEVASLDARLHDADSLIADLRGRLERRAAALRAATNDSLVTLRDTLQAQVVALRDADRAQQLRTDALDAQVASIERSRQLDRKWTAVRDAATVTGLGMITAHVIGSD